MIQLHDAVANQSGEIHGLVGLQCQSFYKWAREVSHIALFLRFATQEDKIFSQGVIGSYFILDYKTASLQT